MATAPGHAASRAKSRQAPGPSPALGMAPAARPSFPGPATTPSAGAAPVGTVRAGAVSADTATGEPPVAARSHGPPPEVRPLEAPATPGPGRKPGREPAPVPAPGPVPGPAAEANPERSLAPAPARAAVRAPARLPVPDLVRPALPYRGPAHPGSARWPFLARRDADQRGLVASFSSRRRVVHPRDGPAALAGAASPRAPIGRRQAVA